MSSVIYRQFGVPTLQNKVYSRREDALRATIGNVELVQCETTGLVFNAAFDPKLLSYDQDYQNEQALSPAFRRHLEEVVQRLLRHFGRGEQGLEIGCGKGYFLELLLQAGANVTGFDPAYEGNNPHVHKAYYRGRLDSKEPDYIVLRHVLEHVPSPWDFLAELAAQSKSGCGVYIEVPSFEWIVERKAFYDVFYEHCNYFSLDVLSDAFARIFDSEFCFGGQYLFVIADISSFRTPQAHHAKRYPPLTLLDNLPCILSQCRPGRPTYVWGAGAKGVTLANLLRERGLSVAALVDINPAKQGRFIARSATPVLSPDTVGDSFNGANVIMMNPAYAEEIAAALLPFRSNLVSVI
jgi:SAM-dependent methyltransferase